MPCASEVLEGVPLMPCSGTSVHSQLHAWQLVLFQPTALATLETAQPKLRPASLAGEGIPAAGWRQHAYQFMSSFIHSCMHACMHALLSKPIPLEGRML